MNIVEKKIKTIFLYLFVVLFLCGCSERQERPNDQTYGEDATDSISDSTVTKLQAVNPFEGVSFIFSGWDGYGNLTIQTGECSQFIKETFDFQLEDNVNGDLSNGSFVTIRAIYDSKLLESQNYVVETDSIAVNVSGLTELITASNFSEEKAWIQYCKEDIFYLACIDKSGKVLFQFEDGANLNAGLFSNGYSHVTDSDGTTYVIDANGTTKSQYSPETTGKIMACGEGYTFTQQYFSNFDSEYTLYRIYNYDGSVIYEFTWEIDGVAKTDAVRSVNYCGEGVFGLDIRYGSFCRYLVIDADKWVGDAPSSSIYCKFSDGIAYVDSNSSEDELIFLTSSGEVRKIPIPSVSGLDWQWFQLCYVNDGMCMCWSDFEPYMMACNIKTGEFAIMDDYYLNKIDWDSLWDEIGFVDGHIAIPLKGSDKKTYIGLFDRALNAVIDPVEYIELIGFSDNRLIIRQLDDTHVYDGLGNQIFSLSEKDIYSISPYSNGVAYTSFFYYVDLNGDVIFENIITEGVKINIISNIS